MKRCSFFSTKSIELLPVFIPIILSLSSWTLYKVIHKEQNIVKTVNNINQYSNPFNINCDFLKPVKIDESIDKKPEHVFNDTSVNINNLTDSTAQHPLLLSKEIFRDVTSFDLSNPRLLPDAFNTRLTNSGYIGEIGSQDPQRGDGNASDNIFDVQLSAVDYNKAYILQYEVDGYADINSVTRSVNGSFAVGGYVKNKKTGWTTVFEPIDPTLLQKGDNKILFNALNRGDYYTVKSVRITESPNNISSPYTIITKIYNDKVAYVRGFVDSKSGIQSLEIHGEKIELHGNEFEYISDKNLGTDLLIIKFKGQQEVPEIIIEKSQDSSSITEISSYKKQGQNIIYHDASGILKGLRVIDLPPADLSTVNVSSGYYGFRFQNNTLKEVELRLPYDEKKLPKGYQEKDITAFTFDYNKKDWSPITIDSINTAKKYLILRTSSSSIDFMAGVVKQPESPETGANAQIAFNDAPIANPASKINMIAPPTPNQQGTANVQYPIEIPAGIGGFQPNVSIVYNSDNKFGWAGTGWDIPIETIDIDTRWGVPSFSAANESEVYLISGEQLVFKDEYLPNKIPYSEARTINRQFYYRNGIKEGYFITRKGSSPSDYTWETLDGSGTKKEYFDVLTNNSSSNSSGNVVKWFLSKVTDRFGNTITYTYADSFDSGGKNKYLSRITYSNNTVIEFENAGGVRGDMTFNYKLGVKLTDSKILSKIRVKRANITIREYILNNNTVGLFSKRLLTEIIQNDGNGTFFNKHKLSYNTSVNIFGNTPTKVYSTPQDNGNAGSFSGGNTSFVSGTYSRNENWRGAFSIGASAGCFLFGINKKGTFGVTGSTDTNKSYGKNQLLDIDGDGLLDKAFYSSNGNINFRKNTKTGFSGLYSTIGLPGETPIYTHTRYNTTVGLEYSFANGVVGINYSSGKSNSPIYFSDVNGDGLLDMIHYGNVFFSKIRNGAPQFFSQPITGNVNVTEETPNAILAGSPAIQDTITTTQFASSLANIVRMWEAPVSGDIHISNEATLLMASQDGVDVWIEKGEMIKANEDISGYNPANSTQISPTVTLSSQGQYESLGATTHVEKGQRIFIIASSKTNEVGDRIKVEANIRYTSVSGGSDIDALDANDNYYFKYNARSHYLPSSQKPNAIGDKSKVEISWNTLNNETFTDDVDFKIYKSIQSVSDTTGVAAPSTLIYHHKLLKGSNLNSVTAASNQILNSDISNLLLNQNTSSTTMTLLKFDVSSDTNVSWEKIKWKPSMTVMTDTDTTSVKALVQYNPYSERLINTLPKDFTKYRDYPFCDDKVDCPRCKTASTYYLFPDFNGNSTLNNYTISSSQSHNTKVTFSLKIKDNYGNVYTAKDTVDVINNVMPIPKIDACAFFATIPISYRELCTLPFYFEISSPDYILTKKLSVVNPFIINSAFIGDPVLENTGHKADYFAYRSNNNHYSINTGLVYQGWGGFTYNGSKYPNQPIRESEFTTNPFVSLPPPGGASPCNPAAPDYYTCMTNLIMQQNNNRYFTPLELDAQIDAFISPMESVEISEYDLQPYVLGVSSTTSTVVTTPTFSVPNPRGIILRSQTESFHAYVSGSFIPWLGVSAHGGISTDKTSDYFQDFNGDHYPDIISGSYYQKTNVLGQLDVESSISQKTIKNKGTVLGAGISASASVAEFTNTANSFFAIGGEKDTHTGSSSFALGIGVNVTIGKAWAQGTGVWADINGDGLTDYISEGSTHINTGNGFALESYGWNVSEVSKGDSFAFSGGGGFSMANGSWAIGVGLSKSKSTAKTGLIDLNGDGLADKIVKNGDSYDMLINSGTSFVTPVNANKDFSLDNKQNSSGFNLYGTLCGCFGVKVCLSGGGGTDKSVTKQEVDLRDFDGDGYPDLLLSENDTQLTYYHNNFPNANLLVTIENPLQGLIKMEYDNKNEVDNLNTLVGATYQMPFSKTVLSKVTIWNFTSVDVIPPLSEVIDPDRIKPAQVFRFSYEKGIQDRRERAFLGFGIVKTGIYNDQSLHQTYVTQYETDYTGYENNFYVNFNDTKVRQYFYKKGIVRSSYMLDNQGRKRSETKYTYKYFDQPSSTGYTLTESQAEPQYKDVGRIIPLLYKTESTFTEFSGSGSHSKTTFSTVDAYDKFGNVIQSTDKGSTLTYTVDDIKTQISYHAPGVKNIVGMPSEQTLIRVVNNEIMRKTTTVLDAAQNIKQIKKDILGTGANGSSGTADFDMEYDTYGNLTKVKQPASANGQRMFYNYAYDPIYHTYLISTTDAYGFTSTTQYDNNYLLGVPVTTTDVNGATSQYTYDSFGRLTDYLAPSDTDFTIRLYYYPSEAVPVAITERKPEKTDRDARPNYFVSLFTDAWGEGIMQKKMFNKVGASYYFANNIYQIKDKLRRPVKTVLRDLVTIDADLFASLKLYDHYTTTEDQAAQIYSTTTYDELDRPLSTTQHNVTTNNGLENLTTNMFYEFGPDRYGITQFATRVVSPLGNTSVTYTDEFGRTTSNKQTNGNDNLWVSYKYNRLNELTAMQDAGNFLTEYFYDKLGRNIKKIEPDAGESRFEYDLSGKLMHSVNPLLQTIGESIQYQYNFDQLTNVVYPDHEVHFVYGDQNGVAEERGRLIKQTDRTGTQAFKYDLLGNVKENVRIVVAPQNTPKMFKTSFKYDVFGRINQITYPDTEKVSYSYNTAGLLYGIFSQPPGMNNAGDIISSIEYNHRDQMTSYTAPNGTKTKYEYDPWGKVNELSLLYTNGNTNIRKNQYTFDGNGNVSRINGVTPMSGNYPTLNLGIATNKTFTYDAFGRLSSAEITAKGKTNTKYYDLNMQYNAAGNMSVKNAKLKTFTNGLCENPNNEGDIGSYEYSSPLHPNAVTAIVYNKNPNFVSPLDCGPAPIDPSHVAHELFRYDVNGNLTGITEAFENNSQVNYRDHFWDHQNRLKAVVTQKENFNYYVYDAAGERILKNDAVSKKLYVNGNNPDETTQMGSFIYYPNGYLVLDDKTMSKHYYMGSQKIATRVAQIPSHRFKTNLGGDYDTLASLLNEEINNILSEAGLPPAVWVQNEDSQGNYSPPTSSTQDNTLCGYYIEQQLYTFQQDNNEECYQKLMELYAAAMDAGGNYCDAWSQFLSDECMLNYTPPEDVESQMYWIHPDHLSGASILTNVEGRITNWYEYMPYGEMLMENTTMNYDHPFKYNGKELDMATGYYYYGARYYDPKRSFWLSVDPLADITVSPYAYVWNDPVNYADPSGLMGERVGGPGDGKKPDPNKVYDGGTIEEVIMKGANWWTRNIGKPVSNFFGNLFGGGSSRNATAGNVDMVRKYERQAHNVKSFETNSFRVNPNTQTWYFDHTGHARNKTAKFLGGLIGVDTDSQNTVIVGPVLERVKNANSVKKAQIELTKLLAKDGKIENGETQGYYYDIGTIGGQEFWKIAINSTGDLLSGKFYDDNTFFKEENILGSFWATARVSNDKKNIIMSVFDSKTAGSLTDGLLKRNKKSTSSKFHIYMWDTPTKDFFIQSYKNSKNK
ncbi:RHS repeat-associated core domain-containing protein [Chryseobacterium aquaticum]|uniref:RHS repeat-associated core domain-containing protein n=1 Tax=Chryseobacterium aquaticum TaxID=452084 RepID=UPI003F6F2F58